MNKVYFHQNAEKVLKKTQRKIQVKAFQAIDHLRRFGSQDLPFPIDTLKGKFKRFHYFEIKIAGISG